jgi:hypothetical protein
MSAARLIGSSCRISGAEITGFFWREILKMINNKGRFKKCTALQGKSHLCFPFLGIARPQSQFPHSCVCERFIYSQDQSTYFPAAELADQSWKYINLSQMYECRNRETEHYNSVLEMTVSFLGIHKWEPDIHIGFSPALHLQCAVL